MRRIRSISLAFVAALGTSAIAAAGASAAKLKLEAGGAVLAAGAPISASTQDFTLTYKNDHEAEDTLRCLQGTVTGQLERNGQPSDNASLTSSVFSGCASRLGFEVRAVFERVVLEHGGTALLVQPVIELQRPKAKAICTFHGRLTRGRFPVNGEPMLVSFTSGHLKDSSVGPFCPLGAEMSATFNITSGGAQVTAVSG